MARKTTSFLEDRVAHVLVVMGPSVNEPLRGYVGPEIAAIADDLKGIKEAMKKVGERTDGQKRSIYMYNPLLGLCVSAKHNAGGGVLEVDQWLQSEKTDAATWRYWLMKRLLSAWHQCGHNGRLQA